VFVDILNTDKKYRVIYADPPWSFDTFSDKGKDRSAENHYSCQSLDDIKKLPVQNISAKDCFLFMWVTFPLLDKGIETMQAWGFTYKTCAFAWVKTNKKGAHIENENQLIDGELDLSYFFTGMGYYARANVELCLLGRKGSGPVNRKSGGVRQLVFSPRREHSRKPDEINSRIEQLLDGPYIELFSRTDRQGWDVWGNQVDKFK
jgi:N6-adenosine-specific RNA methylase IME4